MYDCYNIAIQYLKKRLGTVQRFNAEVYDLSKIENDTDGTYHDEKVIHTLLGQYYLSIIVKKELYFKLKDLEVIK